MKKTTINRKSETARTPDQSYLTKPGDWGSLICRFVATFMTLMALLIGGTQSSQATPPGKQALTSRDQQTIQSVVAKQPALGSEFEADGLMALVQPLEGQLTIAA